MSKTSSKILVVDDDKDFVESTRALLEGEGYQVIFAYDGESGLQLAQKERPDLMMLDVMMASNTEGFEVSRKIPQMDELRDMAVILVTGIREAMNLSYGFEPDETWLPVNSVMEKPVPPVKLLQEIRQKLDAKATMVKS